MDGRRKNAHLFETFALSLSCFVRFSRTGAGVSATAFRFPRGSVLLLVMFFIWCRRGLRVWTLEGAPLSAWVAAPLLGQVLGCRSRSRPQLPARPAASRLVAPLDSLPPAQTAYALSAR